MFICLSLGFSKSALSQIDKTTWELKGYFILGECIDTSSVSVENSIEETQQNNKAEKVKGSYIVLGADQSYSEYSIDLNGEKKNEMKGSFTNDEVVLEKSKMKMFYKSPNVIFLSNDPTMLYFYVREESDYSVPKQMVLHVMEELKRSNDQKFEICH
jgi:hypothetical protein